MSTTQQKFHSQFGGTWADRQDAGVILKEKLADGIISEDELDRLQFWMEHGYVILPGAVPAALCDELSADLARIWEFGSATALMQEPDAGAYTGSPVNRDISAERMRLVDLYGVSRPALDVLTAPAITRFLELVFEQPALLFQGLTFEKGSQQGLHQDTAYVVVDEAPMELAASWVALEDVSEGSGELMYLDGSHRLPDFPFSEQYKHWNPDRDGYDQHEEWVKWLVRRSEELGFTRKTFLPQKGDVLIWSADLVHGGSPVGDPTLTRRSMVGHYCPVGRNPQYFGILPNRTKVSHHDAFVSSAYYDVRRLPDVGVTAAQPAPDANGTSALLRLRSLAGRAKRRLRGQGARSAQ